MNKSNSDAAWFTGDLGTVSDSFSSFSSPSCREWIDPVPLLILYAGTRGNRFSPYLPLIHSFSDFLLFLFIYMSTYNISLNSQMLIHIKDYCGNWARECCNPENLSADIFLFLSLSAELQILRHSILWKFLNDRQNESLRLGTLTACRTFHRMMLWQRLPDGL